MTLEYLALVIVGTAVQCLSFPIPMFPSISVVVVDIHVLVGFIDVDDEVVIAVGCTS